MKKKIFGSIIFMILLIITSLYIYIDNFEITSEDLPTKNEAEKNIINSEETEQTVTVEKKETVIKDSVKDLIKEKHMIMESNGVAYSPNIETTLTNEREVDTDTGEEDRLDVKENTTSETEQSVEVSKVEINESQTNEESNKKSDEKTLDDETIEAAKDDANTKDKAQAMALAMKRLSPEQIRRLMTISKGGFTVEEKAEALKMFYENFTKEEQEWILLKFEEYMGG
jgi:hypothetical protein